MNSNRPKLIRLINYLYRNLQTRLDAILAPFELSSGTYPILLSLSHHEGVSQNQVCRELHIDKALAARAVQKLIALGYLKKQADAEDCRACRLFLTAKAKTALPEILRELESLNNLLVAGMDDAQQEAVLGSLTQILDNCRARYETTN
jgi:DNA-binding MarR family transcriptional regulator